jgi:hypothetical protein
MSDHGLINNRGPYKVDDDGPFPNGQGKWIALAGVVTIARPQVAERPNESAQAGAVSAALVMTPATVV